MARKFTFTTQVYDKKTDFPATGDVDVIYIDASKNTAYRYDDSYYKISSAEVNVWGALGSVSKGGGGGGSTAWGSITGTLSSQTDLQTALDAKQNTLVSGTSIKTINSTSLLGSGDVAVQPALVSGTNIKTIEGQSLLGSGDINLTSSDVGLGNVDNTSDLNKPISTATQTALNAKQNTLLLTTTGTSGAATLVGSTLNIPQYGSGAAFGVHSQKFIPSGSYTTNALNFGAVTSVGITANRLNVAPYFPNQSFTCQSLNIQVAGAIAGGLARIVIYSDVNGVPSAKLYESADLDCSTTGVKTATLTFSFTAGTAYWIGVAGNNSLISLNFIPAASMYTFSTSTNLALYTYAQAVITYPTLPATLSTLTYIGNAFPFISIRKS